MRGKWRAKRWRMPPIHVKLLVQPNWINVHSLEGAWVNRKSPKKPLSYPQMRSRKSIFRIKKKPGMLMQKKPKARVTKRRMMVDPCKVMWWSWMEVIITGNHFWKVLWKFSYFDSCRRWGGRIVVGYGWALCLERYLFALSFALWRPPICLRESMVL